LSLDCDGFVASVRRAGRGCSRAALRGGLVFTDVANSRRIGALCGGLVRYAKGRGWMAWNGQVWVDNAEAVVMEMGK